MQLSWNKVCLIFHVSILCLDGLHINPLWAFLQLSRVLTHSSCWHCSLDFSSEDSCEFENPGIMTPRVEDRVCEQTLPTPDGKVQMDWLKTVSQHNVVYELRWVLSPIVDFTETLWRWIQEGPQDVPKIRWLFPNGESSHERLQRRDSLSVIREGHSWESLCEFGQSREMHHIRNLVLAVVLTVGGIWVMKFMER